jgi:hypothetical protein
LDFGLWTQDYLRLVDGANLVIQFGQNRIRVSASERQLFQG